MKNEGLPEDTKNFIEAVESARLGDVIRVIVTVKLPFELRLNFPSQSVDDDRLLKEAKEMIIKELKVGEIKDIAIVDVKKET
ncbi:MAG: hypothetical protein JRI41_06865 [Deltaproteobacteria bacterium]|nr:hypothetical protein [Deltaproteobacteria bacterium]